MQNFYNHPLSKLKKYRKELIDSLLKDNIPDFLQHHTRMIDDYFCETYEKSSISIQIITEKTPYAIIALGGYGRKEQCLHSDIDILFLFKKDVPDEAEALIREMIYPLWDIGFQVGHATRSIDECVDISDTDIEVLTSLLDARFICGMGELYLEFMKRFREKMIRSGSRDLIAWLIEANQARHQRFGDSSYLLEPHLKEGEGGLRDYHTMLWIARITSDIRTPRGLEYYGYLSYDEFHELTASLRFIWQVRNRLHHLVGKKYDRLHFSHQEKLAEIFNFSNKNGQQPVEKFLGELHGKMTFLKQQLLIFLYELEAKEKNKGNKIPINPTTSVEEGLEIRKCGLKFASPQKILRSPHLLIKIFEESARLKFPLSAEAKRLIKDFSHVIDEQFRTNSEVIQSFEQILLTPTFEFSVLNEMLNTGFLTKFIPEFDQIINRIQYDEYHLYPVDKHSLRTVQTIKKFGTSDDPTTDHLCGNLYQELANKKLLLWAALLHDIGKGKPGGNHSQKGVPIVRQILTEKGYDEKDIETVAFLVMEHLFLIQIATRRDILDEETSIICARRINDIERLKMLYLLTVADSISTGPKAWNNWTSSLLKELFLKVLSTLKSGELTAREAVEEVEKKKEEILRSTEIPEQKAYLESLLKVMSPRYLLYTLPAMILEHIELFQGLSKSGFVWKITKSPDLDARTVTICAKDCPGLFSKIAGAFTLNGIDILDAQVYTWRNQIALDVFKVRPPLDQIFEDEKWEQAGKVLDAALSGNLDIATALSEKITAKFNPSNIPHFSRPNKINVDNESSSFFTIIEVFAYDMMGLLFKITDALFRCDLDIWLAKIATNADQIVDVFYVRDLDGQKADTPEQVSKIKETVKNVLPN